MPSTVLKLVQEFADKTGLPSPTALIGSTEKTIRQYRALLNETIRDLAEYRWPQQRLQREWTGLAAVNQGPLLTIFGEGYQTLAQNTIWNRTRKMRVFGPVSEQVWQALSVLPSAGPEFQYWVSGGNLYISPAPALNDAFTAVYWTKAVVLAVDATTTKADFTVDSDSLLFPDNVVLRCFEYKWRKQKGESGWEDSYNDYMTLLARNIVKDTSATLSLASHDFYPRPGIVVPAGSWNV